jgi:hypothetical protein
LGYGLGDPVWRGRLRSCGRESCFPRPSRPVTRGVAGGLNLKVGTGVGTARAFSGIPDTSDPAHHAGFAQPCGRRWAQLGLNQRPPACEAGALPLSYAPRPRPVYRPAAATIGGPGRARRGASGSLNPQSAPAGLNSLPRGSQSGYGLAHASVDGQVPRTGSLRTASGPGGSSAKQFLSGAVGRPGQSERRRHRPESINNGGCATGHFLLVLPQARS